MWLLKTEPSEYAFDDLERAVRATWDGVRNPTALRNLGRMKLGDGVVVYHTGAEKAAVGLAEVAREAYPDPRAKNAKLLVVDLLAGARLPRPVTLAELRALPEFAQSPLVRQPRLSVVPLLAEQWRLLSAGGRA